MADTEINQLTELSVTPASGDWLVIDDASAIAGAPSPPATKKISVDTLLSFIDDLTQTLTNKTINSSNNTITVTASDVSDFDTEVSNNSAVVANTAKNSYPSADSTKLAGIESNATADQTDSEIKTAYENNADTNAFTDANNTKLSGIETSADVTDSTNVNSAGAIMESDVSSTPAGVIIDDDTMATASNTKLSTSESIKAYVDNQLASDISLKGDYNASTNSPDLDVSPSGISKGDHYVVSVAGTFFTESLQAGDSIISKQDNPTALTHWIRTNNNLTTPITDSDIASSGITTRSKLPSAIAYEDEANTFSLEQEINFDGGSALQRNLSILQPNLSNNEDVYLAIGKANSSNNAMVVQYNHNTTQGDRYLRIGSFEKASNTGFKVFATQDISIEATNKLYLDGGTDTYITESSANVLRFFVGGTTLADLKAGSLTMNTNKNIALQPTGKLHLSGDTGDTYITETNPDLLQMYVGGQQMMVLREGGTNTGVNIHTPTSAQTDSSMINGSVHFYVDETNDDLNFKVKYSNGTTVKTNKLNLTGYYDNNVITIPSDPSANVSRVYAKQVDSNNDGYFIKQNVGGTITEVRIA